MTLLILYLTLAIVVSFLCSILEAVLLSITPSYIAHLVKEEKPHGLRLKHFKEKVDEPLAAILSLNTIAHTVGAAGVGAQAAFVFGDDYLGVVSGVLTFLILVFSEIIPKTLGARYWRQLSGPTSSILQVLIVSMYPLVWLSRVLTKLLSQGKSSHTVSRSELTALAEWGQQRGVFLESESRVIKNLLYLREITVEDVMTPRTVMMTASQEAPLTDLFHREDFLRFSRIPIYQDNLDQITGYIHKHELLEKLARDHHEMKLKDIRRDMIVVPDNTKLPVMFEQFIEEREQIALVTDEYGGTAGIVTLEDIIETLLGMEIVDEFDTAADMQHYARERWKKRATELGLLPPKTPITDSSEEDTLS